MVSANANGGAARPATARPVVVRRHRADARHKQPNKGRTTRRTR
jgi:hypothetical protein